MLMGQHGQAVLLDPESRPRSAALRQMLADNAEPLIPSAGRRDQHNAMNPHPVHRSIRAKVERLVTATGVTQATALAGVAESAYRLRPLHSDSDLPIGASRFGGEPDVPGHFTWPMHEGLPLTFLAQINLSEVGDSRLPTDGWLLFFYAEAAETACLLAEEATAFRVIHVKAEDCPLVRVSHPSLPPPFTAYQSSPMGIKPVICLPVSLDYVAYEILKDGEDLMAEDDRMERYHGLRDALLTGSPSALKTGDAPTEHICHLLLGHPQPAQNDMREDELCYPFLDSSRFPVPSSGEGPGQSSPPTPGDWQLLLQLDSDRDRLNWMWGDMGYLYFWITKRDLAALRFDRCWMVLQCY